MLKIALSIWDEIYLGEYDQRQKTAKPYDFVVEFQPDATVRQLTEAIAAHVKHDLEREYGLVRYLVSGAMAASPPGTFGYLPSDALLIDCGLADGTTLVFREREDLGPELPIDTERDELDLFLVDERGMHRGRVNECVRRLCSRCRSSAEATWVMPANRRKLEAYKTRSRSCSKGLR